MNLTNTVKRVVCFLIAVMLVFAAVGCKEESKGKKKKVVIIRNQAVVKPDKGDDDDKNNDNSGNSSDSPVDDDTDKDDERPVRPILELTVEEKVLPFDEVHKETFYPEFESEYVDWAGPEGFAIVYSPAKVNGALTNMRVLSEKLQVFFKDSYGVNLAVYKDTDPALAGIANKILVGDTSFKKSTLKETEFAVTLLENGDLFFEGGFYAMAEKAVDWFRTIEVKDGKVATLYGTQDNFKSTMTIDGQEYVYVWGDEFDGVEHVDSSKWAVGKYMATNPDLAFIDNEEVCGVENGRLRLTGIRYLPEDSDLYEHATHGSYDSSAAMAYKNGFIEIYAKLSYTQGSLPPLWLMSNPEQSTAIPKIQYTAPWTVEVDIFETFSNGYKWDVSFHKYYKPYDLSIGGVRYSNGITYQEKDSDGNIINKIFLNGEEIYSLAGVKDGTNKIDMKARPYQAYGIITSWRDFYDSTENRKQEYCFEGKALEELNDTYHAYGYLHNEKGYKVYLDGECWLEREWDTAFDGIDGFDCYNNAGFGYELYYYLIMNQFIYTPGTSLGEWAVIKDNRTLPISSWIDHVRLYQLPDQVAISTPPYEE